MAQRPPTQRVVVRRLLVVVVALVPLYGWVTMAGAHSFLVSTSPFQGQRLDSAPEVLVLEFSEAVDLESVRLELQAADGGEVRRLEPELEGGGLAVRAAVGPTDDGVYVVAWEARSAVDGHGSLGEFAFAVGAGAGSVPSSTQSEPTDPATLVASWLFTAGLAAFLGAAVIRASGGDQAVGPGERDLLRRAARPGLAVALGGVGVAALVGRSDLVALSVVAQLLLMIALIVVGLGRGWRWPILASVAAGAVWATRSHGAGDGLVGWAIDFVHLIAGSAWLGSLVLVVIVGWRLRREGESWLPVVRTYARPALGLVLVLGSAGIVGAVRLVPSWSQLWSTTYGRVVVVKLLLFAGAALAALLARRRGLGGDRPRLARRVMSAEAVLVLGAAGLAGLLVAGAPPLPPAAAEQLLGPPPLGDDVARDAGLAGQLNVEIASDGQRLDISVFGPSGPLAGTQLDVSVQGPRGEIADLAPRPCGAGCFTLALGLEPGATSVAVTATASDLTGGYFEGRLRWPPGDREPDRLASLVARMRQVPELTLTEQVDSGPGSVSAPGTFTIDGDAFVNAEPWAAANLEQVWFREGDPDRLTLYVPGSQIFAQLELDPEGRIATERLVTPGHLITREFQYLP